MEAIMKLQPSKWNNNPVVRLPESIMKPAAKQCDLAGLIAGITPENRRSEVDWGNPEGGEEW